jgi:UDP-2,3-diacylglucosamine hydrolase
MVLFALYFVEPEEHVHVFISDAHIRNDSSERCRMLVDFLRKMRPDLTGLYILGDLFEIWFEYHLVFPKDYFRLLAVLYTILNDGTKIHYILGNHEIAIGNFLRNFGFIVHRGPTVFEIDKRRVLLAHGNTIDKRLWTSVWENLLNSRLNHTLFRLLHPDIGISLAQYIARFSRKQNPSKKLDDMLDNYASRMLGEVDIVMLAHSHNPVFRKVARNKYYINTGDWVKHFSYATIDKGRVALRYYESAP